MRSVGEIRAEVDRVDEELVRLLARRIELVRELANAKVGEGMKLVNLHREAEVLNKVRGLSSKVGVNPDAMEFLFRVIMMVCLKEEVIHVEERSGYWCCRKDG